MRLRGRYYGAKKPLPVTKIIHTQANAAGRAPRMDHLLGWERLQPYVHDGVITVIWRKGLKEKRSRYHVFFRRHMKQDLNSSILNAVSPYSTWRGDIAVMRKGLKEEFVNMQEEDLVNVDFAVKA